MVPTEDYTFVPYMSKYKEPRYVWDYLSDTGFRVVVANAPSVYYVKEIDAILISGWLHLDDSSIAYPAETPGELNERAMDAS